MHRKESGAEKTCRIFGELVDRLIAKGILSAGTDEPPQLQLVTAGNAHEFSQPPKRRGRKPKPTVAIGNVVPIGARTTKRKPAPRDDDEDAAAQSFYDRINALPIGALTSYSHDGDRRA